MVLPWSWACTRTASDPGPAGAGPGRKLSGEARRRVEDRLGLGERLHREPAADAAAPVTEPDRRRTAGAIHRLVEASTLTQPPGRSAKARPRSRSSVTPPRSARTARNWSAPAPAPRTSPRRSARPGRTSPRRRSDVGVTPSSRSVPRRARGIARRAPPPWRSCAAADRVGHVPVELAAWPRCSAGPSGLRVERVAQRTRSAAAATTRSWTRRGPGVHQEPLAGRELGPCTGTPPPAPPRRPDPGPRPPGSPSGRCRPVRAVASCLPPRRDQPAGGTDPMHPWPPRPGRPASASPATGPAPAGS